MLFAIIMWRNLAILKNFYFQSQSKENELARRILPFHFIDHAVMFYIYFQGLVAIAHIKELRIEESIFAYLLSVRFRSVAFSMTVLKISNCASPKLRQKNLIIGEKRKETVNKKQYFFVVYPF